MSQIASQTLRDQVNRIMKQAEAQAEGKCECGKPLENGKCPVCDKNGNRKESQGMGMGAPDTSMMGSPGMDVTASAHLPFPSQLTKLAEAIRYCGENLVSLVDDRSASEKIAELYAFSAQLSKAAQESGDPVGLLENTMGDTAKLKQEQTTPHTGKQMVPHEIPTSALGELKDTMSEDRTDEEWTDDPMRGKKASAMRSMLRGLKKQAQMPGAPGAPEAAPAGPPPAGPPPAPQPGAAPAPGAPMGAPPPPPPGPDPMQIAMQLQQQGALTPESLANAAGISPEEAAAIIAQLTGGTGAPQPQMMAPPPMAGPEAGAPPPGAPPAAAPGGEGMPVTASVQDPAALFRSALMKAAGEDVSKANITASKSDKRPEDEDMDASAPSLPGSEGIASNEAAINFTPQAGQQPRDSAVSAVLNASVPYKFEGGKLTGGYKVDPMLGDKTSSASDPRTEAARALLRKLAAPGGRPLT